MFHENGNYLIYFFDVDGKRLGKSEATYLTEAREVAKTVASKNEDIYRAVIHKVLGEILFNEEV